MLMTRSVDAALRDYRKHLAEKGNRPASVETTMYRLEGFFDNSLMPVGGITEKTIREMYRAYQWRELKDGTVVERSADTHRNALNQAKTFLAWCIEQGWLTENPAARVKGVGQRKAGKEQLVGDERDVFFETCMAEDSEGATAALVALFFGARAMEVLRIEARQVGRDVLFVRGKKNARSKMRPMKIPEVLQPRLHALADACEEPTAPIFTEAAALASPKDWLLRHVKRLCKQAGVTVVTTHGLRGTSETIGIDEGEHADYVARSFGHTETVAKKHYIAEGAVEAQRQRRVLKVLAGGKK